MKISKYEDIKVELVRSTDKPEDIVGKALAVTQKRNFEAEQMFPPGVIKKVLEMGHTSVFEHVSYTFFIKGASRSFLAQITRHRMSSFTSGSQHYQDYSDYGAMGRKDLVDSPLFEASLESSMRSYENLIRAGYPKEEARQVLPNAMQNNLIWTINARSLINFLALRLCRRNTDEIREVAEKVLVLASKHFPSLFAHVGPDCFMKRECTQDRMTCEKGDWKARYHE